MKKRAPVVRPCRVSNDNRGRGRQSARCECCPALTAVEDVSLALKCIRDIVETAESHLEVAKERLR